MFSHDFCPTTSTMIRCTSSSWTRQQNKLFEKALVTFPEEVPDRWRRIAGQVPGKTPLEVWEHYETLLRDVAEIDSGRIEIPAYGEGSYTPEWLNDSSPSQISFGSKSKPSEPERKKGIPWTEEEHRLFLIGLKKYGKGDWRSISRNAVVSRTPTQVASHAQKYFLRLNSEKKEKKRSSIHDITTVQIAMDTKADGPIWTEQSSDMVDPAQLKSIGVENTFVGQFPASDPSSFGHFSYPM